MPKQSKKDKTISEAFEELEKITTSFEEGDIDLEKSIPQFKKGLELASFLKKRLSEIENQIEEVKESFNDQE